MSNNHNYGIILAGGLGTRFWPVSRAEKPKQFLDITDSGKTFFRATYERMLEIVPADNIFVLTLNRYESLVKNDVPELKEENILYEPYNRSTGPCVSYITRVLLERDPEAVMVITPSDHIITNEDLFKDTLSKAMDFSAHNNAITVLGIVPTRPDSNYGYIQISGGRDAIDSDKPSPVKTFTEKPVTELAEVFVKSGEFLWNSGMFIAQVKVFAEELSKHAPEIYNLWDHSSDINQIYADCPRVPFDSAVMEKTSRAMVFPAKFGWADIGNWDSAYDYMPNRDGDGNVSNVKGKTLIEKSHNNIIYCGHEGKLVAVKGLEDMLVVDTGDVLLICPENDREIKKFLSELAMPEYEDFR